MCSVMLFYLLIKFLAVVPGFVLFFFGVFRRNREKRGIGFFLSKVVLLFHVKIRCLSFK